MTQGRDTEAPNESQPKLFCVLCTFRRDKELQRTLKVISQQTRPPDHVVIVDNGSSSSVRDIAGAYGAEYLDALENLGPAGAFAFGMRHVLRHASAKDWLVTLGDDGPPQTPDRLESMLQFGQRMLEVDPWVAAVGRNGALYNSELGVFGRVPQNQMHGFVPVDYLAGSQFHRVAALREVGPYAEELFFGFEEAEYGLRARKNGWSLYAHGDAWRSDRERAGKITNSGRRRTSINTPAWRRYYSARNGTFLASIYGASRWTRFLVAARSVGASTALLRSRRPWREVALPIRGAIDGLRGRLGRVIDPAITSKAT